MARKLNLMKSVRKKPFFTRKITYPTVVSNYKDDFIDFLILKNNINKKEANKLWNMGWDSFGEEGFIGGNYCNFSEFYSNVFSFKHNTGKDEYHETYQFHSALGFFRMLGYPAFTSERDLKLYVKFLHYLIECYNESGDIVIIDYGAGLAQITVALAKALKENNINSKLVIFDIDRFMHKEFLNFVGDKYKLNLEFIDINKKNPYPKLPKFDFMMVKDVFEHVHKPEKIVDNINSSIKEHGVLCATTEDERDEMMHVTPNLKLVRDKLEKYGFEQTGFSWFNRGFCYQKVNTDKMVGALNEQ